MTDHDAGGAWQMAQKGSSVNFRDGAAGQEGSNRSYPPGEERKYRISGDAHDGGSQPRWRADGRELLYIAGDGMLMSVAVTTDPVFAQVGRPEPLFRTGLARYPFDLWTWDMTADAQQFLVVTSVPGAAPPNVTLFFL